MVPFAFHSEKLIYIFLYGAPINFQLLSPHTWAWVVFDGGNSLWWSRHELPSIRLDFRKASDQVYLFGLQELGSVEDLPTKIEHRKDTDHGIREKEGCNRPVTGKKHPITSNKSHDGGRDAGNIGDIWLEQTAIRQSIA